MRAWSLRARADVGVQNTSFPQRCIPAQNGGENMRFCVCGHAAGDHKNRACCGEPICYLCSCEEFELADECVCPEGKDEEEEN